MLKVEKVRMDYQEQPTGTAGMPQFGWVIQCDGRNIVQTAYQLQAASDTKFQEIILDTGWVESSCSAHVKINGGAAEKAKLRSCTRYYVRVRVRTQTEESEYSKMASFVTGILEPDQWKAKFISAETESDRDTSGSTCLRKQVTIDGQVESAFVCVTALGLYNFFINGTKVGEDELTPGWTSYYKHLCYQTYEVTGFLREGENMLGAMLGAGWYKGKMGFLHLRNNYGTRTAFSMQMIVRYKDGREEIYVTDTDWEGTDGPIVFSEIYDGEIYDARLEIQGWTDRGKRSSLCGGNQKEGKQIAGADQGEAKPVDGADQREGKPVGGAVQEEGKVVDGEDQIEGKPVDGANQIEGKPVDGADQREEWTVDEADQRDRKVSAAEVCDKTEYIEKYVEDRAQWRRVETVDFPTKVLTAQADSRVRVMEKLSAVKVFSTPKGESVIDFGQNLTGWVHFLVRGERGDQVRLKCFEMLDSEGNVYTANLRTAKQEICYTCRGGGQEEYHPHFTFMGFRYVQVLAYPQEIRKEDFTAYVLYSRMEQTGTFECSNSLLNQLQHNILWGLKGNFVDIPTDCPQRDERMGWTGDAQIFCRTACYLMNTYSFFRKWMKDVAADQTKEGGVPHVVPDIISGKEENDWLLSQGTHSAAAWADSAVIIPWTLYLTFGDREILLEQYDSMKSWIGFMKEHAVDDIWNYRLQFGDWVALDAEEGSYFGATPNDLTCTAYYAYSTGLFAKIAEILGRKEDAGEYGSLYERIVDKFRRTFFREDGTMTAQTQTAHIVALYFNLVPEEYRQSTARQLVRLLEKENGHLVTGFVGTPYFCHALSQNGYTKEAYDLLLKEDFPSWLYQVKMGATTVWEHWDGLKPDGTMWSPDMNSFNHYAYGAVGEWLYRVVLGIEVDEADPGYHHMIISPQTGDRLEYARGTYESVYGRIRVSWEKRKDGRERRLFITVPHNTTAVVRLEDGAGEVEAEGLVFAEKAGRMEADCGSGEWEISYRL